MGVDENEANMPIMENLIGRLSVARMIVEHFKTDVRRASGAACSVGHICIYLKLVRESAAVEVSL
jgi:hypothetical protein